MWLFDFLASVDINKGYEEFLNTEDALLLDVREISEFKEGHLANAKNLPMDKLSSIKSITEKKQTPIFVYCHSGGRASKADIILRRLGYENVKNIGGIIAYKGELKNSYK